MSDQIRPVRIGDELVTTDESIEVRSPYDDALLGRVPKCDEGHVDRAVQAARRHGRGPPTVEARRDPRRRCVRPARAAGGLRPHHRREAAKPIATARVEAARAVLTFQFAAAEARTMTGEMIAMDAAQPGDGKLGFTLRLPIGIVGAITPFNFPLNLVAHKLAPAIAAGCAVVQKPASQTPFSSIALVELLVEECGLPPGWINVVTGGGGIGGQRHRRPPRHRDDHLHGLAGGRVGHPPRARPQEGGPRARQQRAGDHRAERRLEDGGLEDQGGRLQPRRPVVHLDPAGARPPFHRDDFAAELAERVEDPAGRRPDGRQHRRVGAHQHRRHRAGEVLDRRRGGRGREGPASAGRSRAACSSRPSSPTRPMA